MASGTRAAEPLDRAATITVLIVDDEDEIRNLCRDVVAESGLRARTASTTEQALEILDQYPVDIVMTDLRVPQLGGIELLKRVRETYPQTAVIVLTQYGTIESAVEATRMGAADYVTKPFRVPELRGKLDRVVRVAGNRPGKSRPARATADAAGLRRPDRRIAENAARLPADRKSEPAQLSGPDSGRKRNGEGTGGAVRFIFPGRGATGRSSRWIAPRWFPR